MITDDGRWVPDPTDFAGCSNCQTFDHDEADCTGPSRHVVLDIDSRGRLTGLHDGTCMCRACDPEEKPSA